MKVGIAIYYCNIEQYPQRWVQKCIDSINNQTFKNLLLYELNYGDMVDRLVPWKLFVDDTNYYRHRIFGNYAAAMNYIFEWAFQTCDIVANVNIDDFYAENRIELLVKEIENGADIASSNYHIIDTEDNINWSTDYANVDIYQTLKKGINPISNPCHVMSKKVFDSGLRFDPELVPSEDYYFWMKAIEAGFKIKIVPEYLHYYRQHPGQATHKK